MSRSDRYKKEIDKKLDKESKAQKAKKSEKTETKAKSTKAEKKEKKLEKKAEKSSKKYEAPKRTVGSVIGRIFSLLLIFVVVVGGFAAYRVYSADTFPQGTYIDGVDVSGCNYRDAVSKIQRDANHINIIRDGKTVAEVKTAYVFDIKDELDKYLMIANADPRLMIGRTVDYNIPLVITGGTEETALLIKEAMPDSGDVVYSKDAYINYEDLSVVQEIKGNNIDYLSLSKKIAEFLGGQTEEVSYDFDFNPVEYVDAPDVTVEDLSAELDFAKEYLSEGIILTSYEGNEVQLNTSQMAKVIKYSPDGAVFDLNGAREVAEEINTDYQPVTMTVSTEEGPKTLNNYVLRSNIDIEKTAESLYNAAQTGDPAYIYSAGPDVVALLDHIEVSITNQKLYFVEGGNVTKTIDVITGRPGWETEPGIFNVYDKDTNATLFGTEDDYYEVPVSFWMAFNGGAGMHDATWHSVFGGQTYLTQNGSHGCVGMSLDDAAFLYGSIEVGHLVVIYY